MEPLPGAPLSEPLLDVRRHASSSGPTSPSSVVSPTLLSPTSRRHTIDISRRMSRRNTDLGEATADVLPETLPRLQACLRAWGDPVLLAAVVFSVVTVILSTVDELRAYKYGFEMTNFGFVLLFACEFVMRLWFCEEKREYLLSFFGIIDMLSCIPTLAMKVLSPLFLSHIDGESSYLNFSIMLQLLRTFRIFRFLKLERYVQESYEMLVALESPRSLVFIFGFSVVSLLLSSVMYAIEGGVDNENFASLPHCLYWTVVTISTVGYGDVTPLTPLGKAFAIFVILIGYGAIVAQGIHLSEPYLLSARSRSGSVDSCEECSRCGRGGGPETSCCGLLGTLREDCRSLSHADRVQLMAYLAQLISEDVSKRPVCQGSKLGPVARTATKAKTWPAPPDATAGKSAENLKVDLNLPHNFEDQGSSRRPKEC